ncbi:hypothetical protein OG698_20145 [Streptomyces sp. NBC_01003]|uniref:hypothetical protein n=1 Tax=Streptomyces sp. NBC_01003 TaxID=2903714 RepID=UPI0038678B7A|nr:hypothetical protein OG698_20145 [Streptomyces sp. NBC_01003]
MPSSSEQSEPTAEPTDTAVTTTEEAEAAAGESRNLKESEESKESTEPKEPKESDGSKGVDRRGIVASAVVVAACAGLVLYGVLDTDEKPARHVPTASVTYEVSGEGTADLTWQARSESGKAVAARGVTLPWKKTVRVPLGKPPIVTITLGEKGGRASCQLAIRGKHVQTATAYGRFGRATCQGELPAPEVSESPASAQGEQ